MTEQNYERLLSLLRRREIELEKDLLMSKVHDLVKDHFDGIDDEHLLTGSQLKNLENVAFTSLCKSYIEKFICRQSEKDKNRDSAKQTWVYKDLYSKLLDRIKEVADKTSEEVIRRIKDKAATRSISSDRVDNWFDDECKQDIQLTLLREFISQFSVIYGLKVAERPNATKRAKEEDR